MTRGFPANIKLGVLIALAAIALLFVAPSVADETAENAFARFQLFDNCQPIKFAVGHSSKESNAFELTKESIENIVESRLRSARIYEVGAPTRLFIEVHVISSAFTVAVKYYKPVQDLNSKIVRFTPTWVTETFGTHGHDSGFILNIVAEFMEKFLVEYLRANEEACATR